jgi:hypothetical protein
MKLSTDVPLAFLFLLMIGLVGCSTPPPPATATTFADLCSEANADQRVSLEGYLRLPLMFSVSDTALLNLYELPDGEGAKVGVNFDIGTGANQMEMVPDNFSDDDLRVHTSDNQVVGHTDPVVVAGTVFRYADPAAEGTFRCVLREPVTVERAVN